MAKIHIFCELYCQFVFFAVFHSVFLLCFVPCFCGISLGAMVFETLFVHIADIHIDFYQSILFVLGNHNKQKIGVFFTFKLLISRDFYKYFIP